ncbi:MAG: hypothetical protein K9J16_08660 [Melioribacteraceae bacterium]|nr:hypothetical protein [Melioribacteraceae bacterium]MCF8353784.1 hypothetical protein [Melioribacteraceae bacterium]MCF8393620.1 hypothetical protein [Melioribacteraceae bacterium]MCF8419430.1 hypothetical protein [Melioribacteraceae bacterium]
MKTILKYELSYNYPYYIVLALIMLVYTAIVFFDVNLIGEDNVDYWGGIIALFYYIVYMSIASVWLKENRTRKLKLAPVSNTDVSSARGLFILLPALAGYLYIVLVHLMLLDKWLEDAFSIVGQLGVVTMIMASLVIGRDLLFRVQNFIIKLLLIILLIVCMAVVFYSGFEVMRPFLYDSLGRLPGISVFILWGIVLTGISVYSYKKRIEYLS